MYQLTPNLRNKAFNNLESFLDTVSINTLTRPLNRTILFHAVTSPFSPHNRDTIKFVRHLIYLKADVNIADIANVTPLHEAVKSGSLELVKLLVESGVDIGARDKFGRTAVSLASFMKKEKILKYLGSKLQ